MKKLLTICLIMATIFTVNAQDKKPTKEETVAFINRTTALTVGKIFYGSTTTEAKFNYDSYFYSQTFNAFLSTTKKYSGILWETMVPDQIQILNERDIDIIEIGIPFTKIIKFESTSTGSDSKTEYNNWLRIIIPKEKFESIKKACLRLSEIAKEENKDPFQD
ncbi:hypothetical protein FBBAL38_11759 [Flavobacteria bacterium BAL38]|nr:hypothetical protein FBBAL38_11759 [Flavobacteria bacterium BAL38]